MSSEPHTAVFADEKPTKRVISYSFSAVKEKSGRISPGRKGEYTPLAFLPNVWFRPTFLPVDPFVKYELFAGIASRSRPKRALTVLRGCGRRKFHCLLGCAERTKIQADLQHGVLNLKNAALLNHRNIYLAEKDSESHRGNRTNCWCLTSGLTNSTMLGVT